MPVKLFETEYSNEQVWDFVFKYVAEADDEWTKYFFLHPENIFLAFQDWGTVLFDIKPLMYKMVQNHFIEKQNPEGPWKPLHPVTEWLKTLGIRKIRQMSSKRKKAPLMTEPLLATGAYYQATAKGTGKGYLIDSTDGARSVRKFRSWKTFPGSGSLSGSLTKEMSIGNKMITNIHEFGQKKPRGGAFKGELPRRSVLWWDHKTVNAALDVVDKHIFDVLGVDNACPRDVASIIFDH